MGNASRLEVLGSLGFASLEVGGKRIKLKAESSKTED
jgi:hypothetical protein